MGHSQKTGESTGPTFSRAIKEEVLGYVQEQGGEVKGTAIYIHFALEHHEEIPEILEEFSKEGLVAQMPNGYIKLTAKGKKTLLRLQQEKGKKSGSK